MVGEGLSSRLLLALKALSISRGRFAAELAVDKSVVSRWLNGRQAPSGQNLANITALVATHRPGFTMLDWESDPDVFNQKLGLSDVGSNAMWGALGGWLPESILEESVSLTRLRGDAYEGFWRTTRVAIGQPGRFIHNPLMIRRADNGFLSFRLAVEDMRFEGWTIPTQTQLFSFGVDRRTGIFVFTIMNAVLRHRAELMDGLALTCQRTGGGTPAAVALVMERVGMLSGDPDADDKAYEELAGRDPLAPEGSIPERIRNHVFHDIGPAALAAGGPAIMIMPFARSLSRGPLSDEEEALFNAKFT